MIYILVIVSFFDVFFLLPIITPMAKSLGATPFLMGLAVGSYSVSNMFGNVLAGRSIDRVGAKRIMSIGLAATAVNLLFYNLAGTASQLVLVRILHGCAAGLLAPSAFTLMAQITRKKREGRDMAQSGAVVGTAAIIGPAFSGIVGAKFGLGWIFYSISAVMMLCAVLAWLLIPADLHRPGKKEKEKGTQGGSISDLLKNSALVNAYIGSFSVMFTLGIVTYALPLKVQELALNSAMAGMMISTFGIVAIMLFLLPINKIFDRYEPQILMMSGMFTIALSLTALALFPRQIPMFISMGIFGLGYALMFPSMNIIIVRTVAEVHRGKAFGLFYALFSLGVIVGSMGIGALGASLGVSFLVGAMMIFIMALLVRFRYSNIEHQKELAKEHLQ